MVVTGLLLVFLAGCASTYALVRTDQDWTAFRRGVPINKMVVLPVEAREGERGSDLFNHLLFESFSDVPQEQVTKLLPKVKGIRLKDQARSLGVLAEAHAVLFGRIDRFHERQGDERAVKAPASVAFELYLLDVNSGDLMWWASYDETQREPRGDDLFMPSIFVTNPRWLTARELTAQAVQWLAWDFKQAFYIALNWWSGRGNAGGP
jgi:hypothetical protein